MDWVRRALPNGWSDLLRQIVLFIGAYWLYRLARGIVYDETVVAFTHAHQIVHLERSLHVMVEPSIQQWSIAHNLDGLASWMYLNSHFLVTTFTLAYIYLFRNDHFYFVRNMFMVAMGLALVGYVLYPTAPPRMLPELGFTDSVTNFTGVTDNASVNALFNPYAAVPSMHVCFALMLSVPMVRMARHAWVKVAWVFYGPLLTFVVIATANHWAFDAFAGACVAAVSAIAAQLCFARARPEAWAWEPALAAPARAG
jgi:hypothetical protein